MSEKVKLMIHKNRLDITDKRVFICRSGFTDEGLLCGRGCMFVVDNDSLPIQTECFIYPGKYKPNFHVCVG